VALGAPSAVGAGGGGGDGGGGGGGRDLKVMTQNLYLGSSLDPVLSIPPGLPPEQAGAALIGGVRQIYLTVVHTDFRVRAAAIAERIAAERPDLIGLQEVSDWEVALNEPTATAQSFDFLKILQDELAKKDLNYFPEVVSNNVAVPPIPLLAPEYGCRDVAPTAAASDCAVSFKDRDVILVNEDVGIGVTKKTSGHFMAQQTLPVPGLPTPLSFNRGWALIDGTFAGDNFRFVTTHLEVETFRAVQEAQARELVAGPLATKRPVILVGDLNSAPEGEPRTDSYRIVLKALFADAWWTNFGKLKGFTCCQAEDLANETSQLTSRIDYVLVRLALPTSAHLVNDARIPNRTTPPLWASDHAGVVATIHLF
jgi:endonuclease/exonuclease/phosphatase family metal-dependent hydrolase